MNNRFGFWTDEQDMRLIALRHTDQLSWAEIGRALARSKTCAHLRYCQIVEPKDRPRLFRRPAWSAEAEAELTKLHYDDKLTCREIAKRMGRVTTAVKEKLQRMSALRRGRVHNASFVRQFVPQAVRDERDQRMNAEHSAIAMLCGEPRPGQSALDRQRAGLLDPPCRDYRKDQIRPEPTLAWGPTELT